MKTLTIILIFIAGIFSGKSQQLVYKPINPAFGGDTFNYQWLLSSANAQNQFDEKKDYSSLLDNVNSLDSFSQSINRQVLSELSRKLFEDQFGEGSLKPGNYLFGSLYLQITTTAQGLLINILDTSSGDQSEIVIPK
ncbi:curli assembly protein CsgF [Chryseobacterium carnipullorum]|uniref:Curli production assembly/transport component CsgF n=1 Tax=Chryseobacterium carnipullorum TaxID=1124835 RepID=A0A376EBJ1_CHRCU|nr:curli production assembly/transport component CsgF [Chryseobacterium carnipullorum]MDN5395804.1 curli assembly protein CsgF [Chryseobacterium sp.]AZA46797.1 curli assembly protein CsgF [Chryseobacterium carnipullorum]AZA66160.1 curli assembly protein CsgF [Chryseobacterium carnipullorum]MDN5478139.1 curli assembly protein CsgF [Chryseobacterium sp.]STD05910.1 curli assembly protein CsgF [Chryseobacterium carnipullorum]